MKSRKSRVRGMAVVMVMVALALSACGSSTKSEASGSASPGTSSEPSGSPIDLGTVTALSGVFSDTAAPSYYGLVAWVRYTNAHGGIGGHPVELHVSDDKSDLTAEAAGFQTLYAQYKPVAFVGVGTFDMTADVKFMASKSIPVVGGNLGEAVWNQSPVLFPEGTSWVSQIFASAAITPANAKRFGEMYCEEAAGCTQQYTVLFSDGMAKVAGVNPVYHAEISLTAPNYTAECLAAKQANVQTLVIGTDGATFVRIAQDCTAQGYHPVYVVSGLVVTNAMATMPALSGTLAVFPDFVWTNGEGASLQEYQDAMATYEPGKNAGSAPEGWASGTIFGDAATEVLQAGKPLNSANLMTVLGGIKDDTFGAFTPPLTFGAGAPSPVGVCYFPAEIKSGAWMATSGAAPVCGAPSAQSGLQAINEKL
jgi:branched-chain amino acid transport system substrate-binding protein